MSRSIKQLSSLPDSTWDRFVERCDEATFFHRSGWGEVIQRAYGHTPLFLYCIDSGTQDITGILPLVHVRSWLFGDALISLPFCVYGGVVAQDAESRDLLIEHAKSLAIELGVGHLELRQGTRQNESEAFGASWVLPARYATFVGQIPTGRQQILAGIKRKQRAVLNKALSSPLSVRFDNDLKTFYRLYSTSVRDLGTPVFPKHFFCLLREVFYRSSDILTLYDRRSNTPVCAVLSFYFKDQVLPYYAGQLAPQARELKANDRMYFELMCAADMRGYHRFDFGRSKLDSGAYHYKRHWGFSPVILPYRYHLINARQLPETNPNNPRYQQAIRLWKKLPLPVSQLIGPRISRSLG